MRRLALAIVLVASIARADDDVEESCRAVLVHGKLAGTLATFDVRYTLDVQGPNATDYSGSFELPARGSLNRATLSVNGRSRPLEIRDATAASEAFEAVKNREGGEVRGWAVLLAKSGGTVQVSVAAPRNARIVFDLEITAPTCFAKDVRYIEIPEAWRNVVDPGLRAQLKTINDVGDTCGTESGDGPWLAFASPELARRAYGDQRVGASAGRLVLERDQQLARAELDLAGTLSEIPRDLATVFVVDGSRSMTAGQIEAQRALIAAYLAKAPESRVQVIAYARTARALLPGWMTAAQATSRIDRELAALAPRNGSNVDLGLAGAGDWLSRTSGTKRVILIGDDMLPGRLDEIPPATLRRVLPEHTLVHAVLVSGSGLARDDSVHFAPLAIATDGIGVSAGTPDATTDVTMLLRPITLDQIKVRAPGWTAISPLSSAGSCGDVETLAEGGTCTWWGHGDDTAGTVTIEGLLWGHRVVRTLQPDPSRHRELARELSAAGGTLDGLSPEEQTRVNQIAYAVNAEWSMYAAWGGSDGYADVAVTSALCHCGGSSSMSGISGTRGFSIGAREPPLDLTAQLAPAVASCKPGKAKITASIETTLQEIVDVTVTTADPKLAECVANAIWDVSLMIPHAPYHTTSRVAFP